MIEVKKSQAADLERKRPIRLFMGMAIAIVLFVVAMEYSSNGNDYLFDSDFLDEIAEDMEFIPPLQQVQQVKEEEVKTSDQLEVVEEVYENEKLEEKEEEAKPELLEEEEVPDDILDDMTESVLIEEVKDDVKELRDLDDFPIFPEDLQQWLYKNIHYPESAKDDKVEGKVLVSFIINADGSVSDAKIVKPVDSRLDNEVLRVIGMMPKWQPGQIKGIPCRTMARLPVKFILAKK
ncbi:MAG: energy transducer TonB [Prevotella sp.]|nr:energy transducer TonB [Prevotella sp.]